MTTQPASSPRSPQSVPELPPTDHRPRPYTGPSYEEALAWRTKYLTPSLLTMYRQPLMLVEGWMQYVWDHTGRRYLDGFGGIATVGVGHCHPHVTRAVTAQQAMLPHATTIYLHPIIGEYAQMLQATMPEELSVCYIVNSGSEANDLALLMARVFTGNFDVIALRNGYHGGVAATMGLTAHSTWKYNVPNGLGVHHAVAPDTYRGHFGPEDREAGRKYADDVRDLIRSATPGRVAGFIAETIQGVGGVVVYPEGYLRSVYGCVREAGGVTIADEVQAGFGRTGSAFWGFMNDGVVPDIVTMAKSMGNGAPIAAVVTKPHIAHALTERIHFNTFGGNPVSCAAGKAVLEVMEKERLQENALRIGGHLRNGLVGLKDRFPLIGDVRGRGLMLGVELVKDRVTKEPASAETLEILERTRELGLLIGKGGLRGNVLRIKPPLCLGEADADFLVEVLGTVLRAMSRRGQGQGQGRG